MSTTDDGLAPDEIRLIEALQQIEARFAPPKNQGASTGTGSPRERICRRLAAMQLAEPAHAHLFHFDDPWGQILFVALARRYGLAPHPCKGQPRNTVEVK